MNRNHRKILLRNVEVFIKKWMEFALKSILICGLKRSTCMSFKWWMILICVITLHHECIWICPKTFPAQDFHYTWAFILAAILYWLSIYLCQFSYWAITFLLTWPTLLIVLLSTGMEYKLCFIVTSISDTNKLNKYFTFDRVTWFVFEDVFPPLPLISLTSIHAQRWHVPDQPSIYLL